MKKSLAFVLLISPAQAYAFTGLIETWSRGIFFAVYWPLIVAIAAFWKACVILEGISTRASFERDAIQAKRFSFLTRMVYILFGISAILTMYFFDVTGKMYQAYEDGTNWAQELVEE